MLTCALLCSLASVASADSFDEAVTLYLQGFEHCASAKAALSDNKLDKALKAFAEYEATTKRAAKLDSRILNSTQRGMDSNLKYCNRVGTDIELAQGTPLLEQSLAVCEKSFDALKKGDADSAKELHAQYVAGRDKALSVAPSLNGVFSLKSEIRRCDRLESKIANAGKQQAQLAVLLESAREESESFSTTCSAAHKELEAAPMSAASIQAAEKALAKAEQYKRSAGDAYAQLRARQPGGEKETDSQVENQLKSGNQCLAAFSNAVSTRKGQLARLSAALQKDLKQLESANQQCDGIAKLAVAGPEATRYEQGKARYETARKSRDAVRRSLTSNSLYQDNADGAEARQLNQQLDRLNRCLDTARAQVAALMPPVEVAPPVVKAAPAPALVSAPTPAKKVPAKKVSAVPVIKLTATLQMSGLTPEFVLVYWADGTRASADRDAELFPTGFGKKLYVLQEDGSLQMKNADFGSHSIMLVNPLLGIEQKLATLSSRQSRSVSIALPANTLALLRSNQERVAGSFVVNGLSSNQLMLEFSDDSSSLAFELDNPKAGRQLVVLMPDTDPLVLDIVGGDDKQVPITRDKKAVGTLNVVGL